MSCNVILVDIPAFINCLLEDTASVRISQPIQPFSKDFINSVGSKPSFV